jgi:hypothetical protein
LVRAFHHHLETACFKFAWVDKYVPPVLLAT